MRTTLSGIMLVACSYVASAQQLTVLPQAGLEVSRTSLQYNNLPSFTLANKQLAPQLGVRVDYAFKNGHGPFAALATSRSGLTYSFSDPATGMNEYKAVAGNLRMNMQAGYQLSTKPIYFKKKSKQVAQAVAPAPLRTSQGHCGRYSGGGHCSRYSAKSPAAVDAQAAPKEKGWSMIVHPLAGLALTSALSPSVSTRQQGTQAVYDYEAGNWNTALITGASFEFGNNDVRKFTISMNCLRGLGNLGTSSVATTSNGKTTITNLKSSVSSWNITAGIPITLYKKKSAVKQVQAPPPPPHHRYEGRCGRYRNVI